MTPSSDAALFLDGDQLRAILPHRYPHLMVDRVLIQAKHRATGIKTITMDEPCFQGHFPGNPVFPGILMLEAMIQTGGVVIHQAAGLRPAMVLLLSIDKAKFRRPVVPGDQLMIDAELIRVRSGVARLRATATVRDEPVGQAVFTIVIRDHFPARLPTAAFMPADRPEGVSPSAVPIMDIQAIMNIIPHRYPFLMVDAILAQSEKKIVALKNVSGNESFFNGHFPQYPVMPGTLLVEAMAQSGAVFMLNLPPYRGKVGYFMSVESARFRTPVRPGDQLVISMELAPSRPRIGRGFGVIYVGQTKVAEAQFSFVIMDQKRPQVVSNQARKYGDISETHPRPLQGWESERTGYPLGRVAPPAERGG